MTQHWQNLMDRAYDKWQNNKEWKYRQFLLNLNAEERKAVVLGNFNYQTLNGGLQQWVDNGYASGSGRDLLDILDEMGTELAQRVKAIVEGVLQHVDMDVENSGCCGNYWLEDWVDDEPPSCYGEVDQLTDEFYAFSDEFAAEVERYLENVESKGNAVLS